MRSRHAFSLLEVLIVLAILGMLAATMMPALEMVQERAQRIVQGQELRQIALAHRLYRDDWGKTRVLRARSIHEWAGELARNGGLNTPDLYWLDNDVRVALHEGKRPRTILQHGTNSDRPLHPDFLKMPLSLTVVSHITAGVPRETTPLFWTRGLRRDGTWEEETGMKGGFIGFLDGKVLYFQDLRKDGGALIHFRTGEPTYDVQQALPPGAKILEE